MKTWTAWVTKTERYPVTVQADTWTEARQAAEGIEPHGETEVSFHADRLVQTGEPWAYSSGWYDLHWPGDVIVVARASGNTFTQTDIDLLCERLATLDLVVTDKWNGAGCNTASFRCSGRKHDRQFSKQQVQALTAPRPAS